MHWSSGAKISSGGLVTAVTGSNYVLSKLMFGSPQYAVNRFRLHYSGFASTEGGRSPQETVLPGTATVIDGVWIAVNDGPRTTWSFSGSAGATIASADFGSWTDLAFAAVVPPDSLVTIYTLYHTAVEEMQLPVCQVEPHRGERVWGAADAASLTPLIGANTASHFSLDAAAI